MSRFVGGCWLLFVLAGCGLRARPVTSAPPLVDEGEVYLYALPFPREADRLSFAIDGVSAVRDDGTEIPLAVLAPTVSGPEMRSQRLFASGRLPPGAYTGFLLRTSQATLTTGQGKASLLSAPEPARVELRFKAVARDATVASLTFKYAESVEQQFGFAPAFSAVIPGKTTPTVVGFSTNTATDNLTVFDRRTKLVTGVVETGRAPQGIALDSLANRAYVALSGEDQIDVIDVAGGASIARVRLNPGDEPRELALVLAGRLLVTINPGSRTASFVDPVSYLELSRVQVGEQPESLLVDRAGTRAFVFNRRANTITVLDLAARTVVATIPTDPEPLRGALNRAGDRLFVVHAGSAFMTVYSVPGLTQVNRVFVGLGTSYIKVDPRTDLIYIAKDDENRLYVYDPFSLLSIDDFEVPGPITYAAIDDVENTMFVLAPARRSIGVVDLTSRNILSVLEVGPDAYAVTVSGERF